MLYVYSKSTIERLFIFPKFCMYGSPCSHSGAVVDPTIAVRHLFRRRIAIDCPPLGEIVSVLLFL